jgi:PmbA protein
MTNNHNYLNTAQQLVEQAQKLGAQQAEVYINLAKELEIEVNNQQVETMKVAEDRGVCIRIIRDGRMGFAYSSDTGQDRLAEMVRQAVANGGKTTADEYNQIPDTQGSLPQLELNDAAINTTSVEEKIALAMEIEKAARSYDSRVKNTRTSSYQDARYEVYLANSAGFAASYTGSYCGGYAYLVAEENGDTQTGFGVKYSLKYSDLDPVKIGSDAAKKAVQMLGAKTVNTQKAAVVLDPYIATNFLGLIAPAITGEAVLKGKSLFADKRGSEIAASIISIVDHGSKADGIMSAPFDGEGVATSKSVLVQDGVLQGFLHNTYTGLKMGEKSTGNGVRGSFKSTPEVGTTNFYIAPGAIPKEKLIGEIDNGFYITEVMGMHTANPISGDFSLGAAGLWIEKGKLTKPVRGVAIAGNILELLKAIDCVGDDLTFFVGKGAPTLRIARMSISG